MTAIATEKPKTETVKVSLTGVTTAIGADNFEGDTNPPRWIIGRRTGPGNSRGGGLAAYLLADDYDPNLAKVEQDTVLELNATGRVSGIRVSSVL